RAGETEDRPAAEIDRPDIGAETGIFFVGDRGAHQPVGFKRFELWLVDRQELHAEPDRFGGEAWQRLVPDRIELTARDGAQAVGTVRHAFRVDHLAAPGFDV